MKNTGTQGVTRGGGLPMARSPVRGTSTSGIPKPRQDPLGGVFHRLFIFIIFITLFLFPSLSHATPIVNIDFKGLTRAEEGVLRKKMSSFEGAPYSAQTIKEDIKALYQTGLFSDVFVTQQTGEAGIFLTFHVVEKGIIGSIVFRGNKKINDKDLLNYVSLREFNILDQKRIAESKQAILKAYEEKGYYLVEISTEIVPLDTEKNELELVFDIKENPEAKIKRISFVGNKIFSDRKLSKEMVTKVKGFLSFLTQSGKYKDAKLERDLTVLEMFYQERGYLKVKIGQPQISLTRNKEALYITIPVYEGPQYHVGSMDVDGDILTTKEELLSQFQLKTGAIYNGTLEQKDKMTLENIYGDQAYAYASIQPLRNYDDGQKIADVTYYINKGRKIYIEKINIVGNSKTRDKVIRRELQLVENAPFKKNALIASYNRLAQLGYFEEINFSTPRGSRDDQVILVVEVKEKETGSFSIGAGFSSLESFIFTAAIQKDNFFGYGISGSVATNISKLRQEFTLNATDRYFLDTRWIFSLSAYRYTSSINDDFDEKSFGGSVNFGREIFPHLDVILGYSIEDIEVTNFSSLVPQFFQDDTSGLTSSALMTLSLDKRDNRIFTTKGSYHALSGEYAGNGIGGENDFWKMQFESRFFFKPIGKTVLKARGRFQYVNSLNDNSVPLFERFFLGGINTLRGFDLSSVGPEISLPGSATGDDERFVYGGNKSLLFNVEYEIPIYDTAGLKGVAFFDAGQAYAENEKIDITALRLNYGFGFRWHSPFGPLRFEWGFPINKRSGDSSSVFNFSIGQSF